MNKIFTYKLNAKEIELIKNHPEVGDKEFTCVYSLDELSKVNLSKNILFLSVDSDMELASLEKVLSQKNTSRIQVILRDKNFDKLLKCHRYNVSYIYDSEVTQEQIMMGLLKYSLLTQSIDSEVPARRIMSLFSKPIKVKDNNDLYRYLKRYFNTFADVSHFSILEIKSKNDFMFYGQSYEHIYEVYLDQFECPDKYIGYIKEFKKDDHLIIATPVYVSSKEKSWLLIEIDETKKTYVLNDLFFKFLENALIYRSNKEKNSNLETLANTDEVTGLFNQRKLSQDLEIAIESHAKKHEKFSLMFIDVDHFKSVNDNYGHIIGSKLLSDLGATLRNILRGSDHVYRYGGDEFVVIMPYVDQETVHEIAIRTLQKVKETDFIIDENRIYKMSVSIGIAEYPTDAKSAKEIVRFADEMMYQSKKSGRGKVFHVKEVNDVNVSS